MEKGNLDHIGRDPYAPPQSSLSESRLEESSRKSREEQQYFAVTPTKFVIMGIFSFGLYEIYWFYKNWYLIRKRNKNSIYPFWRAVFARIWTYFFVENLNQSAEQNGIDKSDSAGVAIIYFVLAATWRLPEPFFILGVTSFVPLIPINNLCGKLQQKVTPSLPINGGLSMGNWVVIVAGTLLWILVLAGLFLTE